MQKLLMLIRAVLGCLCLRRKHRITCLHIGQVYVLGLVGLAWKWLTGLPFMVHVVVESLTSLEKIAPIRSRLVQYLLRQASCVFSTSGFTSRLIINNGIPAHRVITFHPAVDTAVFNPSVDPTEVIESHGLGNKKVLLTVGRLVDRKGVDQILRALPIVETRVLNLRYLIVGDGPESARLEFFSKELGLGEVVEFVGRVDDNALPAYYAACDVFITANRHIEDTGDTESFGMVFLEASACGKPVIGGRVGGVPEAIAEGESGLLVNSDDPDDIAQAAITLLTDEALARRLGEQGRRRVEREFNWEHQAEILERTTLKYAETGRAIPGLG